MSDTRMYPPEGPDPNQSRDDDFWPFDFDDDVPSVPDFTPTRHELGVLAAYWLAETYDWDYFFDWTGQAYGKHLSQRDYAAHRYERIRRCLGDAVTDKAIAKCEEEWQRKFTELKAIPRCEKCDVRHRSTEKCPGT